MPRETPPIRRHKLRTINTMTTALTVPSGLLTVMLSLLSLLSLLKVFPLGRVGGTVVGRWMGSPMSWGISGSGFLEKIVSDLSILDLLGQSRPSVGDWQSSKLETLIQMVSFIILKVKFDSL